MRILGIALLALFGLPFLVLSWLALSSRFGANDEDVHGYVMILSTLVAMGAAVPTALSVSLLFRQSRRVKVMLYSLVALVVVEAGLFIALITA